MELKEAIYGRRSVRKYTEKRIKTLQSALKPIKKSGA